MVLDISVTVRRGIYYSSKKLKYRIVTKDECIRRKTNEKVNKSH